MLVPFPHLLEAVRGIPARGRRVLGVGYSLVEQLYHGSMFLARQCDIPALPPVA